MKTMPGSERYLIAAYQRAEAGKTRSWAERLIDRANSEISIFKVLSDYFGIYVPSDTNFKTYCPFADEHDDDGMDKGFRTYPESNSAMCFPMHGYLPPVGLIAHKYNEKPTKAAERVLREYGLLKPRHWRERMAELLEVPTHQESVGNPQHAVEALNVALRKQSNYTRRQFDADVMEAMEICLNALDYAVASGDPAKVREWYDKAKRAMIKKVGTPDGEA